MAEAVHWQLRYADGRVQDEPEDGRSVLDSPPSPLALVITHRLPDGQREPVTQVPLFTDDKPAGHGPWHPIFYRKRSMAAGGDGSSVDLIVFGRACEATNSVSATLWALDRSGTVIDCPKWAEDTGAVENLTAN